MELSALLVSRDSHVHAFQDSLGLGVRTPMVETWVVVMSTPVVMEAHVCGTMIRPLSPASALLATVDNCVRQSSTQVRACLQCQIRLVAVSSLPLEPAACKSVLAVPTTSALELLPV